MSTQTGPLDLFVAVLDGNDPNKWPIWDDTFEMHILDYHTNGHYSAPIDLKHLSVRLMFLLHSEETLHKRSGDAWNAVIGVLVDASGRDARQAAAERVIRLCQAIVSANEGGNTLYKKLRFQIGLLFDREPADDVERGEYESFGYQLTIRAESVLGRDVHYDIAHSSRMLKFVLQSFERDLVLDRRPRSR